HGAYRLWVHGLKSMATIGCRYRDTIIHALGVAAPGDDGRAKAPDGRIDVILVTERRGADGSNDASVPEQGRNS
ncbi:MAG: hypothetical protein ACREIC_17270, partial [Limisphaerales bacterium]